MKKVIKHIAVNRKQLKVKNYKEFFNHALNLLVKEDMVDCGYGHEIVSNDMFLKPSKIFYLGERIYYHRGDKLYCLENMGESEVCTIGYDETCATQIIYGGIRANLFINSSGAKLVDGKISMSVSWVDADIATEHNGRLFSAKNRIITFSEPFDFEMQSIPLKVSGSLRVDRQAGSVVGFFSNGNTLYIFCQRAVYTLQTGFESIDFIFKKEQNFAFEIIKNSFATFADGVYFVGNNKLYKFTKSKLVELSRLLDISDCTKTSYAGFYDGIYCLPLIFNEGENNYLYVYDIENGAEGLISMQTGISYTGHYFLGNKIVKISRGESISTDGRVYSKTFYLSDKGEVDLYEISFYAGESGKLSVQSKTGVANFSIKKGFNAVSMLLPSEQFKVEFSTNKKGFSVKELCLKYIEKGE